MEQALAEAAVHNAAIIGQRARADAAGEAVTIGEAGYFPNISVEGTARAGNLPATAGLAAPANDQLTLDQRSLAYSVTLQQPIFDGFKTYHTVASAEASASAERQDLAGVTETVLTQAAAAFADVIRNRSIVALRKQNVANLTRELTATEQRSAQGDASEIDMRQASARLADASDALAAAEADRDGASARYQMVIGHAPGELQRPVLPAAALPGSLDEALAMGAHANPRILSALNREDASRHDIGIARSAMLPKVAIEAQYQRSYVQTGLPLARDQSVSVAGRASVPLFDGGAALAQTRQAKFLHAARLQALSEQRAAVASDIAGVWAQLAAARKRTSLNARAVEAHRAAVDGLRRAREAGQRTTLEVLDGERDLIEAEVRQQNSKRDLLVAAYALLAAIGQLLAP